MTTTGAGAENGLMPARPVDPATPELADVATRVVAPGHAAPGHAAPGDVATGAVATDGVATEAVAKGAVVTGAVATGGVGAEAVATEDGSGRAGSALRAGVAFVASIASAVSALLLVRNGIRTDEFPPFLPGTTETPITRYSGPWITAGAGAALLAVLFLLFAVADIVRWSRSRPGGTAT
ncbi:hypothetical protein ACVBEQ_20935 [Nakamurella sp. GG22]